MAKVKKSDSTVVVLECSIKRGETVLNEVTVNKPQSGALRGVKLVELMELDVNALIKILPRVTQPSLSELELMQVVEPCDLLQLGTSLLGFLVPKSDPEYPAV